MIFEIFGYLKECKLKKTNILLICFSKYTMYLDTKNNVNKYISLRKKKLINQKCLKVKKCNTTQNNAIHVFTF
jgi:hypothetical protein